MVKLNASSNLTDYSGAYGVVLGGFGTAATQEFNIEFARANCPRIWWGGDDSASTGYFNWMSGIPVETQKWQHIVFVVDDVSTSGETTVYLYINGVESATKTLNYNVTDIKLTESFFIGSDSRDGLSGEGERAFQGAIKYVGASSEVKTAEEIAKAYNNSITYSGSDDDYGLDRDFVDPVVDDGPITSDTVLSMRFNEITSQYEFGFGVDFSNNGANAYQLSEGYDTAPHTI